MIYYRNEKAYHYYKSLCAEKRIAPFPFQRFRIARDVFLFAQGIVQQVNVFYTAFCHQVEEILLDDGNVIGKGKLPAKHLRHDFKRAVGRIKSE
ncbi:Uncharacterised protein [Neisseria gonorrhoeae]|uniref:Uncharacterized protein n=1 Tax=Neisseria gonorrhoeae TaxID=485 RepID=A0A378W0N3_NEIGO|nr:Uncharacterised protein [Neisseria gonorrhoeae]